MNTTLKIFEEEKSANALVIRTYGGLGEKVVHLYHVCTAEGEAKKYQIFAVVFGGTEKPNYRVLLSLAPASEGWEKVMFSEVCVCLKEGGKEVPLVWSGVPLPQVRTGVSPPSLAFPFHSPARTGVPLPPLTWQGQESYAARAVCLLRSRRRTFLYFYDFCKIKKKRIDD